MRTDGGSPPDVCVRRRGAGHESVSALARHSSRLSDCFPPTHSGDDDFATPAPLRSRFMEQKIIDLYDRYTHGGMSRRAFFDKLAVLAGGTAAATAMLSALKSNYAVADTIAENDSRITAETVTFKAGDQELSGYLVKPAADGKFPSVVLVHQNRGLNPHIKDVARRLAVAGYLTLGVDFLSPIGGTPADEEKAREMNGSLKPEDVTKW